MPRDRRDLHEFRRGWRVLTASFFGIGVSMISLLPYSTGVFIKPLEEEFGWTRAEIGFSGVVYVVTLSVVAPLVGNAIDRIGLRLIATASLVLYSLGIFGLSSMNGSLTLYYAIIVGYTIVGIGSSPIAFHRAVTAWFVENRGLALGISSTSPGIAGVLLPILLTPWVAERGWRAGYRALGVLVLVVVPLVWLWIRDRPADPETHNVAKVAPVLDGDDVRVALRQRNFWFLSVIFFAVALAASGLIVSFIPILLDMGFSARVAGSYAALIGASVIAGRLLTGFAIDRIFAPFVAATIFTLVAFGCLGFLVGGARMAFVAAVGLGFALGAEIDLLAYFTARYFGMRNYATLYACLYGVFSIGGGLSVAIAGRIYDVTGDYEVALLGAMGLLILAALLCLCLSRFPDTPMQRERRG